MNKKVDLTRWLLILVLLLAGFLRLYRLGSYPSLNADEAAIGYNAWSLLQTGKDEHGQSWPIHFKSFGDHKPGAYFYLVLPLIKLLGLNEWAVRLPSALAGISTVCLVFLLAILLWNDKRLALIWSFVLAVSPWHVHFSRGGWESNLAVFLMLLGTYLFFKFKIQNLEVKTAIQRPKFLILSAFSFIAALYTYHSARVLAPLLVLGLAVFNWKLILKNLIHFVFPISFGVLLVVPLAISFLSGGASARFSGVGLFADSGPLWRVNELLNHHQGVGFPFVRLIHNKPVIYSISFFQKYLSHFDGRFLFVDGDEVPRSKLPDMGLLHLFEFLFLFLGLVSWLRNKRPRKYLPFLLLVVAPFASAMTFQAPSALRALIMVVPLTFFVACGINSLLKIGLNKKTGFVVYLLLAVFYFFGLSYWQDQYFNHYLRRFSFAWPGGFKELSVWISENGGSYKKIYISDRYDQPYILMLFYLQYPPGRIQKEIALTPPDQFGFSTVRSFDKFCFGLDKCGDLGKESGILIAAAPDEWSNDKIVTKIYTKEGNLAFNLFGL
ncbi:glycosyltransferase family 39 protein [Patescibacteria group bacterium]|nr:glycosyltransferase family 39 protein [Patescibacteria group bacterium]